MTVEEEKQSVKYRRYIVDTIEAHGGKCDECENKEWLRLYHPNDGLEQLYLPYNVLVLCRGCHMKKYPNDGLKRRPGRGFDKFLRVSVKVLSLSSGKCCETVRRHIRAGSLNPNDLISITEWLSKNRRK